MQLDFQCETFTTDQFKLGNQANESKRGSFSIWKYNLESPYYPNSSQCISWSNTFFHMTVANLIRIHYSISDVLVFFSFLPLSVRFYGYRGDRRNTGYRQCNRNDTAGILRKMWGLVLFVVMFVSSLFVYIFFQFDTCFSLRLLFPLLNF